MADDKNIPQSSENSGKTSKEENFWLTTKDNPFNPFTQFEEWLTFDESNNYFSSGLLARIAKTSNDLSNKDNNDEIHSAMAWIVANDPSNNYTIVTPSSFK